MKVWKVTDAGAYSPVHGAVTKKNNHDLGCCQVEVRLNWWDRMRCITLQQKLELEVLKQRIWCAKQNQQERERQAVNEYMSMMVHRLNEQDKPKLNDIEIRKS